MLFVGDQFGQLNSLEFYKRQMLEAKGETVKNSPVKFIRVSADENLIFATPKTIYYEPADQELEVFELETAAPIVGVDSWKNDIIYSCGDGGIYRLDYSNSKEAVEQCLIFEVGVITGWQKGFLEPIQNANQYCMIGSKIPPIVVDLNREVISWRAKNVSNDELELKVPINDVDGVFYNDCNNLVVCHKDRKLRLYDIKKGQRRPISNRDYTDEKSNFTQVVESLCKNYFYVSNAQGSIFVCDKRKELAVCGKFKGATGSITGLQVVPGHYLVTSSLDSYVRVYNTEDNKLITSFYVGTPLYSLLVNFQVDEDQLEEFLQTEGEKPKIKAPKRRNTVELPYLARKQLKKEEEQYIQEKREE